MNQKGCPHCGRQGRNKMVCQYCYGEIHISGWYMIAIFACFFLLGLIIGNI